MMMRGAGSWKGLEGGRWTQHTRAYWLPWAACAQKFFIKGPGRGQHGPQAACGQVHTKGPGGTQVPGALGQHCGSGVKEAQAHLLSQAAGGAEVHMT